MSEKNTKDRRKPIHVSCTLVTKIQALAKKRELSVGEAADHLLGIGLRRVATLKRFAESQK